MRTKYSHLRAHELLREIEVALQQRRKDDYEELLKELLLRHWGQK